MYAYIGFGLYGSTGFIVQQADNIDLAGHK